MDINGKEDTFDGKTHHFTILAKKQIGDGENDFVLKEWDGYIHTMEIVGQLVGVTIKIAKAGSKLSGMMDGWARMATCALEHGASVNEVCTIGLYTQFEPAGLTRNPEIPKCSSLLDYVCRYISSRYVKPADMPVEATAA
jgi:ribonucleoside-diphosphate reductase alpha chain